MLTWVGELKSLLGLQQTALQHCQDTIAGLEETITQLVTSMRKLEKTVCCCCDWLLSLGPHYAEGEEEVVVDSEEEGEDDLEYETDAPSRDSYTTPPSTGGCSEPLAPTQSPTPEDSNPETNGALCTMELEAHIKVFLEEAEDMELDEMPPLKNIMPLLVPAPFPGFIPFAVSTSQHCVPPKALLNKVFHPYQNPVGQCRCEPGGWCHKLPCSSQV